MENAQIWLVILMQAIYVHRCRCVCVCVCVCVYMHVECDCTSACVVFNTTTCEIICVCLHTNNDDTTCLSTFHVYAFTQEQYIWDFNMISDVRTGKPPKVST